MQSPQSVADRVGWISPAAIRAPAFAVLDRLQKLDPAVQITATAVALLAMSEAVGKPFREVIEIAERTLADSEGPYTEHIQAIRMYAHHEILRGGQ